MVSLQEPRETLLPFSLCLGVSVVQDRCSNYFLRLRSAPIFAEVKIQKGAVVKTKRVATAPPALPARSAFSLSDTFEFTITEIMITLRITASKNATAVAMIVVLKRFSIVDDRSQR